MIIDWSKKIQEVVFNGNSKMLNEIENDFKELVNILWKDELVTIRMGEGNRIEIEPLYINDNVDIRSLSKYFNVRYKYNDTLNQAKEAKDKLLEAAKDKPELLKILQEYFELKELENYLYRVNLIKTENNASITVNALELPIRSIQAYIMGVLNKIGVDLPNITIEDLIPKVNRSGFDSNE